MTEGAKLYADVHLRPKINRVLTDVLKRYAVKADQFVLGGFSAGGTVALRYTELCHQWPTQYPIKPKGVFAVDSPVDLIYLWGYFEREKARNFSPAGVGEAQYVLSLMTQEHGALKLNRATYNQLTPFDQSQSQPGNERFLKDTAVRMYHEVDVNWFLTERRRSLFDTNIAISSELINRRAEFVQSSRKGTRSNGMRHPHSWSIVDEADCLQWLNKL
jgi:pimeloyl-ACP methyl ester carboxylesterase